ncbi:MAG: hypothetical protein WC788_04575 [Candidatus Paceibacterota bacterium]|jgi:hypothetical protein
MSEKPEKPKISNEGKKLAQRVWTGTSNKAIEEEISNDLKLLGERNLIWQKIEGIRKDARQKGKNVNIPADGSAVAETSTEKEQPATVFVPGFEPIACTDPKTTVFKNRTGDSEDLRTAKKMLAIGIERVEENISEMIDSAKKSAQALKQKDGGKILWEGKQKETEMVMSTEKNKPENFAKNAGGGHILSLYKAARGNPEKRRIKHLRGKREGASVEVCTYLAIDRDISAEIDIRNAKIMQSAGHKIIQIGDLRIVIPEDIETPNNILTGKFALKVIAIRESEEQPRAFFPQMKYHHELNGERPILVVSVDKEKREPCENSYHTTPSFNGDIVHLEPRAE